MKDLGYFLNQRDKEDYKRINILIIMKSLYPVTREIERDSSRTGRGADVISLEIVRTNKFPVC